MRRKGQSEEAQVLERRNRRGEVGSSGTGRDDPPPHASCRHQKARLLTSTTPALRPENHARHCTVPGHATLYAPPHTPHATLCAGGEEAHGGPRTKRTNNCRPPSPPLLGGPKVPACPYSKVQANVPQNTIKPTVYIMHPRPPPAPAGPTPGLTRGPAISTAMV